MQTLFSHVCPFDMSLSGINKFTLYKFRFVINYCKFGKLVYQLFHFERIYCTSVTVVVKDEFSRTPYIQDDTDPGVIVSSMATNMLLVITEFAQCSKFTLATCREIYVAKLETRKYCFV